MLDSFVQNCSSFRVGIFGLPRGTGFIRMGSAHGSAAVNRFAIEHPLLAVRRDSVRDAGRDHYLLEPAPRTAGLVLRKGHDPYAESHVNAGKLLNPRPWVVFHEQVASDAPPRLIKE